jgi:hypothetical protein
VRPFLSHSADQLPIDQLQVLLFEQTSGLDHLALGNASSAFWEDFARPLETEFLLRLLAYRLT